MALPGTADSGLCVSAGLIKLKKTDKYEGLCFIYCQMDDAAQFIKELAALLILYT